MHAIWPRLSGAHHGFTDAATAVTPPPIRRARRPGTRLQRDESMEMCTERRVSWVMMNGQGVSLTSAHGAR